MKKLRLITLAAGAIIAMTGAAAAQQFYFGVGPEPGPRPYYRDYPPGYHDRAGYYRYGERRQELYYYRPGRYRTWNGCQPGWTVQDGLCKPYRGY